VRGSVRIVSGIWRRLERKRPLRVYGGSDGLDPQTGLVEDKTGSLYGATYEGGAYNMGTIFKIIP
jgi:uncharacterized repeat protein (TIGR03803 family)